MTNIKFLEIQYSVNSSLNKELSNLKSLAPLYDIISKVSWFTLRLHAA